MPMRGILLAACLLFSSCDSGPRALVDAYGWKHSHEALVLGYHLTSGMSDLASSYFTCAPYGCSFMRLMGDGSLYYGDALHIYGRQLDEAGMRRLVSAIEPHGLVDLEGVGNPCGILDVPSTVVEFELETLGHVTVSDVCGESDRFNAVVELLRAQRRGGVPVKPAGLWVGSALIDPDGFDDLNAARPWPLANVNLLLASRVKEPTRYPYFDWQKAVHVQDHDAIRQVLPLLGTSEDYGDRGYPQRGDQLFVQDGSYFAVVHALELP